MRISVGNSASKPRRGEGQTRPTSPKEHYRHRSRWDLKDKDWNKERLEDRRRLEDRSRQDLREQSREQTGKRTAWQRSKN